MNSKEQGTIGELAIIQDLIRNGCEVFREITDISKVDLVAVKGEKIIRLQVKCVANSPNDVFTVSSVKRTTNGKRVDYEKHVDCMAVYIMDRNRVCYVPMSEFVESNMISIRFAPTKSGQKKRTRNIEDFSFAHTY